jgi:cytochrome c-type biogenesis protein CcmF
MLSREFTYYLSSLILVISTAIVLAATVLPSFTGLQMGPQFYNRLAPPIGLVFLLVLTLCPLFSWRKTDTGKLMRSLYLPLGATAVAAVPFFFYWRRLEAVIRGVSASRQPAVLGYVGWLVAIFSLVVVLQLFVSLARQRSRRFETGFLASLRDIFRFSPSQAGGYLTHLGVAVMVIGLVGSSMFVLNTKKRVENVPGAAFEVDNLVMSLRQVDTSTAPNRETYGAIFDIYNKNSRKYVGTIRPKIVFYQLQNQSTREVDIRYEPLRDIFVIFEGIDSDNKLVMNTFINPLISWVWVGSLVLILGSLLALLPHRHDVRLESGEE